VNVVANKMPAEAGKEGKKNARWEAKAATGVFLGWLPTGSVARAF
jgi:hypothetical protein